VRYRRALQPSQSNPGKRINLQSPPAPATRPDRRRIAGPALSGADAALLKPASHGSRQKTLEQFQEKCVAVSVWNCAKTKT